MSETSCGSIVAFKVENDTDGSGEKHFDHDSVSDISQTCRVCACVNNYFIPIYDGEGVEHDLGTKINQYLPINVSEEDELPTQLCYQCASLLITWHEMFIGSLKAEEDLRKLKLRLDNEKNSFPTDEEERGGKLNEDEELEVDDTSILIPEQDFDQQNSAPIIITARSIDSDEEKSTGVSGNEDSQDFNSLVELSQGAIENEDSILVVEDRVTLDLLSSIQTNSSNTFLILNERLNEIIQNNFSNTREKYESSVNIPEKIKGFSVTEKDDIIVDKSNSSSDSNSSKSKFEMSDKFNHNNMEKVAGKPEVEKCGDLSGQNSDFDINNFNELTDTCQLNETDSDENNINISEEMKCTADETGISHRKNWTTEGSRDNRNLENSEGGPPRIFMVLHKEVKKVDEWSAMEENVNSTSNFELKKVLLTAERPFYCDICGLTFKRKDHVRSHKKWVHLGVRNKDFKCEKCGKMLKSNDGLEQHMRRHLNLKPFQCKECLMAFFSRRCLLKHSKVHYNSPSPVADGIYQCMLCSNKFDSEQDLQIHHNWHRLPLICDICSERFEFKKQLLCHKRVHTTYHPYKCNICSESFRQNRSLQAHTLKCPVKYSSSDEKKLKTKQVDSSIACKIYDKMLSFPSAFDEDNSIYSKKKTFACMLSEANFSREEAYVNHTAYHEVTTLHNDSEAVCINVISDLNS